MAITEKNILILKANDVFLPKVIPAFYTGNCASASTLSVKHAVILLLTRYPLEVSLKYRFENINKNNKEVLLTSILKILDKKTKTY